MFEPEKICVNCAHWNISAANRSYGIPEYAELGLCDEKAIEPDAGAGAVILLGPDSHCQWHSQCWEPAENLDIENDADASYRDNPDRYNGVTRGIDYPATLGV